VIRSSLAGLALAQLVPLLAFADERPAAPPIDVQRFRQDPVGQGLPGVPGAELLPRGGMHAVVGLSTAMGLLEGVTETEGALVSKLTTLDVGLAYGLGVADVFVSLPLHLDVQGGAEDLFDRPHLTGFGVGDVAFGGIVRILDVEELTFGLSFRLEATLPTGEQDRALGWDGPTIRPSLVTEFRASILRLVTETAVHLRPRADALGVVVHHALGLTLGLAITPTSPTELRGLELAVLIDLEPDFGDVVGEQAPDARRPAEWRFAILARPTPCVAVQAGGGTGIGAGWGTPRVRMFLALNITLDATGRGCGDRSAL
jgi:hypothetical protein